jgi:hypothetical protein
MQPVGPYAVGTPPDRASAIGVLQTAVAAGVDHIDTAQYDGPGVVNDLIREALCPYPDELAIVSKVAVRRDDGGVRLKLCAWYVAHQAQQRRFAEAAASAWAGLVIDEDADLAWKLITVLLNDGKAPEARQALVRYKPGPGGQDEIRMWMQLHLGVPVTPCASKMSNPGSPGSPTRGLCGAAPLSHDSKWGHARRSNGVPSCRDL